MTDAVYRAAERLVREAVALERGERAVIVTTSVMPSSVPAALMAAATAAGAEAAVMTTTDSGALRPGGMEQPSREPDEAVAAAMERADVIFEFAHPILNNTEAELTALAAGARVLRMLLWDFYRPSSWMAAHGDEVEAAFVRAAGVDIPAMASLTRRVAERVARAREARILSAAGTDLTVRMQPRESPNGWLSPTPGPNPVQCLDGQCREPGTWDECAGGNVGAICADAEGVLVVDHSIHPLGLLDEPIVVRIEGRRAVALEGGREAAELRRFLEGFEHEDVWVCPAEWGLGTHPGCIDSGHFIEHEKAHGAVHVALGDDRRFGGDHAAPTHIDGVLREATVELDGERLLEDGGFVQ